MKKIICGFLIGFIFGFLIGGYLTFRSVNDEWKEKTKYYHGHPTGKNLDDDPAHRDKGTVTIDDVIPK